MRPNSIEAYDKIKLSDRQREVLAALNQYAPCTRQRLAKLMKWEINRICGRVSELLDKGLIYEDGFVVVAVHRRAKLRCSPQTGV